jgi:hypothetical protein
LPAPFAATATADNKTAALLLKGKRSLRSPPSQKAIYEGVVVRVVEAPGGGGTADFGMLDRTIEASLPPAAPPNARGF